MKTCAVVPAAGLGKRLGLKIPKILAKVTDDQTIWSILRNKLLNLVDHIHLIVAKDALQEIRFSTFVDEQKGLVSVSIQPEPIGMGDAIFQGIKQWEHAQTILIVWGDQVFVSEKTLKKTLELHAFDKRTVVLPLVEMENPYVEYVFDKKRLIKINQSREGEICQSRGLADVGTFALSVPELLFEWKNYLKTAKTGSETKEINFLPFLPFLSMQGWTVQKFIVDDLREARGINTMEDLKFFRNLFNVTNKNFVG